MKSKFEITGVEAYLEVLQKAGRDIDLVSRAALHEAASDILQPDMIARVPHKTGIHSDNIRAHIKIFSPSKEGHFNYVEVGVIQSLDYTDAETARQVVAVEFGTTHSAAEPFLRPAVRAKRTQVMNLIRARLQGAGLVD